MKQEEILNCYKISCLATMGIMLTAVGIHKIIMLEDNVLYIFSTWIIGTILFGTCLIGVRGLNNNKIKKKK